MAQVVTTIQATYAHLNAEAIMDFAAVLQRNKARLSAPVEVRQHRGQRDQDEGATLLCTIVHGQD